VKGPALEVMSAPGLGESLESMQLEMPGPYVPSVHVKLVGTDWPTE
jgi:hypothetical protein